MTFLDWFSSSRRVSIPDGGALVFVYSCGGQLMTMALPLVSRWRIERAVRRVNARGTVCKLCLRFHRGVLIDRAESKRFGLAFREEGGRYVLPDPLDVWDLDGAMAVALGEAAGTVRVVELVTGGVVWG